MAMITMTTRRHDQAIIKMIVTARVTMTKRKRKICRTTARMFRCEGELTDGGDDNE